MVATDDVSLKNTKNEILDAYYEVLQELKETKKTSKQETKKEQEKQSVIKTESQNTADQIVTDLANVKLAITRSLEELEKQLLEKHKKLINLNQAIELQNKSLEELYEIKANTDTLAALLQAQKLKKENFEKEITEQQLKFEQEMIQKRAAWKREQEEVTTLWKEQESLQKKVRQREEEEYIYKRELDRQKERDQHSSQKQLLEKELVDRKALFTKEFAEREANIAAKEQELQKFKAQVEEFPKKLQEVIAETEKTVADRLKFKYDYEIKFTQKEVEGDKKLHQQMIATLETKIAQQEQQIKSLTEKASHAGMQVQEIALKAIEGASGQKFYYSGQLEKNSESKKEYVESAKK